MAMIEPNTEENRLLSLQKDLLKSLVEIWTSCTTICGGTYKDQTSKLGQSLLPSSIEQSLYHRRKHRYGEIEYIELCVESLCKNVGGALL